MAFGRSGCDEGGGLLAGSTKDELEPSELGVELAGDDEGSSRALEDHVDHAMSRRHGDLRTGNPGSRERTDKCLDHRRLEAIDQAGSLTSKEPHPEVRSEAGRERDEGVQAGDGPTALDP